MNCPTFAVGTALCVAGTASASFDFSTVALNTWAAPGMNGGTYGDFAVYARPTVNPSGIIGFSSYGVWIKRPSLPVSFIGAQGTAYSAHPGVPWYVNDIPAVDSAGRVLGIRRTNPSPAPLLDQVSLATVSSKILLAGQNMAAPGGPAEVFRHIYGDPVTTPNGRGAFYAEASSYSAIFRTDTFGSTTIGVRNGVQAPASAPGELISGFVGDVRMNAQGGLAQRIEVAVPSGWKQQVAYFPLTGSPTVFIQTNDPLSPFTFFGGTWGNVSVNNAARVAYQAYTTVSQGDEHIVRQRPGQAPEVIARRGASGPGMAPGDAWVGNQGSTLREPLINGVDHVVFAGTFGQGNTISSGLWSYASAGDFQMVCRTGTPTPGFGAGLMVADIGFTNGSHTLNNLGDVLFSVRLDGPGVTAQNDAAVMVWNRSFGLVPVLREGQAFQVAPGDVRTVAYFTYAAGSGGQDGVASSYNDGRRFVVNLGFTDGSSGIFESVIPAPISAIPVLFAGLQAVRRRRGT